MNYKNTETQKLENISKNGIYIKGVNLYATTYSANVLFRHMIQGNVLELGPAEGIMTRLLAKNFNDITVVEGSKTFSDNLKLKFPKITVINKLFEEFDTDRKFNNIILGHVLEHVDNPSTILSKCKRWLKGGILLELYRIVIAFIGR